MSELINEKTLAELEQLDFGSVHSPNFSGLKIVTLEDILRTFPRQAVMNIHVKTIPSAAPFPRQFIRRIADLLIEYDCAGHAYFMAAEKVLEAALECGATVVNKCFHLFMPHGVSGVVIISESHLAIHTWPEFGYAAVDLFTCGEQCDPKISYEFLKKKFNSKDAKYSQLNRGLMDFEGHDIKHQPFKISESF